MRRPRPGARSRIEEAAGLREPAGLSAGRASIAAGVMMAVLLVAAFFVPRGADDGRADEAVSSASDTTVSSEERSTTSVAPQPEVEFPPGAQGTIRSIDGSTLTVESGNPSGVYETTVVVTTADTAITEALPGSIDDLAVGDHVVTWGDTDEDGALVASAVVRDDGLGELVSTDGKVLAGFGSPEDQGASWEGDAVVIAGDVTALDGTTMTIESDGSPVMVTLVVATITVVEERSLEDLARGDAIDAVGEVVGDQLVATLIQVGDDVEPVPDDSP